MLGGLKLIEGRFDCGLIEGLSLDLLVLYGCISRFNGFVIGGKFRESILSGRMADVENGVRFDFFEWRCRLLCRKGKSCLAEFLKWLTYIGFIIHEGKANRHELFPKFGSGIILDEDFFNIGEWFRPEGCFDVGFQG